MSTHDDIAQAHSALEAVGLAEGRLAGRMERPLWRHMLPALMIGLLLIATGLGQWLHLIGLALVLFAIFGMSRIDRQRFGMKIAPKRSRAAFLVTLAMIAVAVGTLVMIRSFTPSPALEQPQFWIVWLIAIISLTALDACRFEALRRELRRGVQ